MAITLGSYVARKFLIFRILRKVIFKCFADLTFITPSPWCYNHPLYSFFLFPVSYVYSGRPRWVNLWRGLRSCWIGTRSSSVCARTPTRTCRSFWAQVNRSPPSFPSTTLTSASSVSSWKVVSPNATWELIDVRFSDLTKLFEKEVGERRDILQAAVSFYRKVRVRS